MYFRKASDKDINRIMEIIKQAQNYLKANGINQWQDNYPNINIIEKDIDRGDGYVLLIDNEVVATLALSFEGEKTYEKIYEGKWITEKEFGVIHRIAVDNKYKGNKLSACILEQIEKLCMDRNIFSIKVDTHEKNESMKKMLINNGFIYCGVIYLENGSKRIAFEKIL